MSVCHLADFLTRQQAENPDRIYIEGELGPLSYNETLQLASRLCRQLVPVAGDLRCAGLCIESPQALAVVIWSMILADVDVVFLPLCRDPESMEAALQQTGAQLLLTDIDSLAGLSTHVDVLSLLEKARHDNSASPDTPLPVRGGESAAFLFQTSGTSGEPKWVQCTFGQFSAAIDSMQRHGALEHAIDQRVFLTPPLYHSYGLGAFLEYTSVGSSVMFPAANSPLGPVGELRQTSLGGRVTAIEGVPFFYSQLSRMATRVRLPRLKHLGLGGGALNGADFSRLASSYPDASVSVRYGLTETPGAVAHSVFLITDEEGRTRGGRIMPVYTVGIVGARGQELMPGEEGEVCVSGDCVGNYSGQTGNRLLTGDTGHMTTGGELVISGRKSLFIKNRGYRISPELVESVIMSVEGVSDCRVLMRDGLLVAELVCEESGVAECVLKHMQDCLPFYAVTDRLEQVDNIPRTASGKIMRRPGA